MSRLAPRAAWVKVMGISRYRVVPSRTKSLGGSTEITICRSPLGRASGARFALAIHHNHLAVIDAGRHIDGGGALFALASAARAGSGGSLMICPVPRTGGAGAHRHHKAAARAHLAGSLTGGTGGGVAAFLGAAGAVDRFRIPSPRMKSKGFLGAKGRLLKADAHVEAQVISGARAAAALGLPRCRRQRAGQRWTQTRQSRMGQSRQSRPWVAHPCQTDHNGHARIREDFIGLIDLLEAGLAGRVIGVQVGVTFLGQGPVGLLMSSSDAFLSTPSTS